MEESEAPESAGPRYQKRGALLALVASTPPLLIMASDVHSKVSVPVGFVCCLIAAFGVFDCLGTLEPRSQAATVLPGATVLRKVGAFATALLALLGSLVLAVAGVLPASKLFGAVLVTASFIGCVITLYRLGQVLDVFNAELELLERHGFWLIVINSLVYLPLLGSFSLSDPWETHYGEVAREMLARDDWLSLWWAQDGWFWSKPILNFWAQGLSFSLLQVPYQPDQLLAGFGAHRSPAPEWAARLPVFLMALVANYVLYKAVAKAFGRRAGFLSGLALMSFPYWFLLSHQSMTDMPYVAPLTACMGFFLLAVFTNDEEMCRSRQVRFGPRAIELSAYHLLYATVILCVLPQILYLLSRNVTLHLAAPPYGFRPHLDEFFSGSGGGNCGLPGNEACREKSPVNPLWQPAIAAVVWSVVLGLLLYWQRQQRRLKRLYFMAAWVSAALAAMAKGAPGLAVPVFTIAVFLVGTGRWREFRKLELGGLLLVVACIVLPWYFQMLARHGSAFLDRLLFHDMWKRAFAHVHDTNDGVDTSFRYYIWQLGYGLFPLTGFSLAGLAWWLGKDRATARGDKLDASACFLLWFVTAFGLFTLSLTKFHHYILPAVPPLAALTGVLLDTVLKHESAWPSALLGSRRRLFEYLASLSLAALLGLYGVLRLAGGSVRGSVVPGSAPEPPSRLLGALLVIASFGLIAFALWRTRRSEGGAKMLSQTDGAMPTKETVEHAAPDEVAFQEAASQQAAPDEATPQEVAPQEAAEPHAHIQSTRLTHAMFGALALASAVVLALVGRDFFSIDSGNKTGQLRLLHLFTYNYRRGWPRALDYEGVILAFVVVTIALTLAMTLRRLRPHAVVLFSIVSLLWATWGVNVYMVKTAPHWGQRDSIAAYYRDRPGPEAPLVAYQMNWKGENFYTGNRVPAFVSSQAPFKKWITEQRARGVRVMYFSSEHGRVSGLKREIGEHKSLTPITDEALNNKFIVTRVEF